MGRLCPRCGSQGHGRPWARVGQLTAEVSLARADGVLLTAVALPGPAGPAHTVGVDVEAVQEVHRRWQPGVVLHPQETAQDLRAPTARAWTWVAKEALLKAAGVGLDHPMTELLLGPPAPLVRVELRGSSYEVRPLPAPPGYAAALATRCAMLGT